MKEVLDRDFLAVDMQGNELRITCLTQLIKDWGFADFLKRFGFDFGKAWGESQYVPCEWSMTGYYVKRQPRSEFMYILKDVQGRHYSPDYIVSLFEYAYPATSKALWQKEDRRYFRRYRSLGFDDSKAKYLAKIRTVRFKRQIWQENANLLEMGLKPIRKIKSYYESPYEDNWYRKPERNWKRFRKTQYK